MRSTTGHSGSTGTSAPGSDRPPVTTSSTYRGVWSRGWVRVTTLVIGFAVVMVLSNSFAVALGNPVAALVLGPLLGVLVLWLYRWAVRRIERRPVTELPRNGTSRDLLVGAACGLLLGSATIGVIALFGGYQVTAWGSVAGALTIVGMMCAIAVAEEVLFRGVIFRLIEQRFGTWLALVASAALFGLVHLVNPGATAWGAAAVAIEAGLMLGAAFVATGSLWLPIGLHVGWNITIAAIFGTVTSGGASRDALVIAMTPGPEWLTGGTFGPEASIIAVLLCSLATVALLVVAHRRGRIVAPRRRAPR